MKQLIQNSIKQSKKYQKCLWHYISFSSQQISPTRQTLSGFGMIYHQLLIVLFSQQDIVAKVLSFSQQRPRAVCILSGSGTVSSVTLRQPASSVLAGTYEVEAFLYFSLTRFFFWFMKFWLRNQDMKATFCLCLNRISRKSIQAAVTKFYFNIFCWYNHVGSAADLNVLPIMVILCGTRVCLKLEMANQRSVGCGLGQF